MKTQVQMYQAPEGTNATKLPEVMFQLKDIILSYVTTFMRLLGIAKITLRPSSVGIKTFTDVSFKPIEGGEPPEDLLKSRNFTLRNLADMMVLYGILDVEIQPDENEKKIIFDSWEALKAGKPMPTQTEQASIPLNVDPDPTGTSVLSEPVEVEVKDEAVSEARPNGAGEEKPVAEGPTTE